MRGNPPTDQLPPVTVNPAYSRIGCGLNRKANATTINQVKPERPTPKLCLFVAILRNAMNIRCTSIPALARDRAPAFADDLRVNWRSFAVERRNSSRNRCRPGHPTRSLNAPLPYSELFSAIQHCSVLFFIMVGRGVPAAPLQSRVNPSTPTKAAPSNRTQPTLIVGNCRLSKFRDRSSGLNLNAA